MKRFYLVNIFLDLFMRISCLSSHSCLLAAYMKGWDVEEWTCTQSTSQHACVVKDRQSLIAKFGEAVGQVIPIPPTTAVCGQGEPESRDCRYTKDNVEYSTLRLEWEEWSGTGFNRIKYSRVTDGQNSLLCPYITSDDPPFDCAVIYRQGQRQSGVYTIYPNPSHGVDVYCDMVTDGGGWTVFQKRQSGEVDFYRSWVEYAQGFGDINGEHWFGLYHIHTLTQLEPSELYVGVTDFDLGYRYARYGTFHVAPDWDKFRLTVASYSGNGGDTLTQNNGKEFTTNDQDNDSWYKNCGIQYRGGWWYPTGCGYSNLNGPFPATKTDKPSMYWYGLKGSFDSMKASVMMLRPASFKP